MTHPIEMNLYTVCFEEELHYNGVTLSDTGLRERVFCSDPTDVRLLPTEGDTIIKVTPNAFPLGDTEFEDLGNGAWRTNSPLLKTGIFVHASR